MDGGHADIQAILVGQGRRERGRKPHSPSGVQLVPLSLVRGPKVNDRRHGDDVIRIRRVPHPQKKPEDQNRSRGRHACFHANQKYRASLPRTVAGQPLPTARGLSAGSLIAFCSNV
jgi:hypothetical protein